MTATQNLVRAENLLRGYKVEVRNNRRWLPAEIRVRRHTARPRARALRLTLHAPVASLLSAPLSPLT